MFGAIKTNPGLAKEIFPAITTGVIESLWEVETH
jgi:hypothetical protein